MSIKTILLMAQTLDGRIAKDADHFPDWTGRADKKLFVQITRESGVLIMGRRTFDTIGRPLPDRKNVVMTRDPALVSPWDNLVYTTQSPPALLAQLEAEGYRTVVLAGGAGINSLFARAGLIDELIITITPLIFGTGIGLFDAGLSLDLELEAISRLDEQRVCLRYRVRPPAKA